MERSTNGVTFSDVYDLYDRRFKQSLQEGELPMRSTSHGFFGSASLHATYEFFTDFRLERFDSFLDLGSGDGRVVNLAALFTYAVGVEGDSDLVEASRSVSATLGLDSVFVESDFFAVDWSGYDVLFINPDKPVGDRLIGKAKEESKILIVYNDMYNPSMDADSVERVGEIPFFIYHM